jgi:hypothetical protein
MRREGKLTRLLFSTSTGEILGTKAKESVTTKSETKIVRRLIDIWASSLIRRCHRDCPISQVIIYSALQQRLLARNFCFRQGLWTEGLRTPPGQECSNGSLTFFAVVLWRTFFK